MMQQHMEQPPVVLLLLPLLLLTHLPGRWYSWWRPWAPWTPAGRRGSLCRCSLRRCWRCCVRTAGTCRSPTLQFQGSTRIIRTSSPSVVMVPECVSLSCFGRVALAGRAGTCRSRNLARGPSHDCFLAFLVLGSPRLRPAPPRPGQPGTVSKCIVGCRTCIGVALHVVPRGAGRARRAALLAGLAEGALLARGGGGGVGVGACRSIGSGAAGVGGNIGSPKH